TGDRAYLSEGMLYITGREKDVIIRGGRNISPYELEEAVGDLAGVRRGCVAVFGSRHRASATERVVVLAETRGEDAAQHQALKRKINDLALSLLGGPVDDIVLAPPHTVPKTSSGKIRRVAAREYYERGASAVRPQAVWLQFVRLAVAGVAPRLARGAWASFRRARLPRLSALDADRFPRGGVRQRAHRVEHRAHPGQDVSLALRYPGGGAGAGEPARRPGGDRPQSHQLHGRRGADVGVEVQPLRLRREKRVPGQLHHEDLPRRDRLGVRRAFRRAEERRERRRAGGGGEARRLAPALSRGHVPPPRRAAGVPHRRFPGRGAGGHPGSPGGPARRALDAARGDLVRAPLDGVGQL